MAKYVIEDTTLTNIANAIREKTGKTDAITPANFDTEIASIEVGGGGDTSVEDGIINGTIEEYSNNRITSIRKNCFYGCTFLKTIDFPLVTEVKNGGFNLCPSLTSVNLPLATYIGDEVFNGCTSLMNIELPLVTYIGGSTFQGCTKLTTVNLPVVSGINSGSFRECTSLTKIEFLSTLNGIAYNAFYKCSNLKTLILRSETMCRLSATGAFNSTPIESGTGYIYVPDDLVDSYKSATNWSTYADQIKPISELEAN